MLQLGQRCMRVAHKTWVRSSCSSLSVPITAIAKASKLADAGQAVVNVSLANTKFASGLDISDRLQQAEDKC